MNGLEVQGLILPSCTRTIKDGTSTATKYLCLHVLVLLVICTILDAFPGNTHTQPWCQAPHVCGHAFNVRMAAVSGFYKTPESLHQSENPVQALAAKVYGWYGVDGVVESFKLTCSSCDILKT